MSVQSAMRAAVSGLAAQSSRLGAISDNISNSQTVGYKRSSVDFSAIVTRQAGGYQAGGVTAMARTQVSKIGLIQAGAASTDMAISGSGFFVVSGSADSTVLTRAGSFRQDNLGNLVNSAGYVLMGWPIGQDGTPGSVDYNSLDGLQKVNVLGAGVSAQATTSVTFSGNVPSGETGPSAPTDPFRTSVEFYDALGNSNRLFMEWQPSATENAWTLSVTDASGAPYGSVDVEFADSGPGAGAPLAYANAVASTPGFAVDLATGKVTVQASAGTATQPIEISIGTPGKFDGVTQFAADFNPKTTKDGAAVGELQSVEVTENGMIVGVFSNNTRRNLWQVPLANVINPDGLTPTDGNTFQLSATSGDLRLYDAAGGGAGSIAGGALEGSNVDIAEELTDMIVTQRAYSTNAKIIQTADEMLEEVARLKR